MKKNQSIGINQTEREKVVKKLTRNLLWCCENLNKFQWRGDHYQILEGMALFSHLCFTPLMAIRLVTRDLCTIVTFFLDQSTHTEISPQLWTIKFS